MIGKVLATGSLALLYGVIAYAPADKLVPRLLPADAGIAFYELSGSLLDGQAGYITVAGVSADDLHWRVKPLQLLTGSLGAQVAVSQQSKDLSQDNAWLRTQLRFGLLNNSLKLTDLTAVAGLEALQKPLKISYLPLSGNLRLEMEELALELDDDVAPWPSQLVGRIQLLDTQWKLGEAAAIGNFSAQLSQTDGVLLAQIEDSDEAKLSLRGQAELQADRSYSAQLQLKAKADTPTALSNQMKALGRTDAQGWYRLKQNGRLPGF